MKKMLFTLLLSSMLFMSAAYADNSNSNDLTAPQSIHANRPDVSAFIDHMVKDYHFNRAELETLFNNIHIRAEVLASIQKPYEAQPWYLYRPHFITPTRISDGVIFWKNHEKTLANVSQSFQVPIPIIVAIVGVETNYGRARGKYSVLDTLSTLAFDYPPRSKFFSRELEQYLLLCREQGWDPTTLLGSYAGAVGQPQFMPSSYRAYAVDYSKDGQKDLFDNIDDIMGSIANYLHQHGWQMNAPIMAPADLIGTDYLKLPLQKGAPAYTLSELTHYGIRAQGGYSPQLKAIFFQLDDSANSKSSWVGFNNFYVITRYNTSYLYAMAVAQLANEINVAHKKGSAVSSRNNAHG